jgi:excinuclease ABC subunit A
MDSQNSKLCKGSRLKKREAMFFKQRKNISELCEMDISDLTWFQELNIVYLIKQKRIATEVIKIRADYTFR